MDKVLIRKCDRRAFLASTAVVGAHALLGFPGIAAADPPPETTRIRLLASPALCLAPQYLAEAMLAAEGFTQVEYVKIPSTTPYLAVASGAGDISMDAVWNFVKGVDAGESLLMLGGVHLGCYELLGTSRVRTIRELKGKTVPVSAMGASEHIFLSSMAAYVGLDPRKDINWIVCPPTEAMQLLAENKVDAFLAFPPQPQELRARGVGQVVVNTAIDKPWSQYYCCVVLGNRDFVRQHPVATKRALRAILKATDLCASEPERAAKLVTEKGFSPRYEYALDALTTVSYRAWRTHSPEDTLRFTALRMKEVGIIKSNPQTIIRSGTDWRFLNELKRELKA